MQLLQYFFECSFNEDEDFENLDHIINRFKAKETENNTKELINDLHQIISTKNYLLADNIMKKYGNRELDNIKEVEMFIHYIYDRFLGKPTDVKSTDFEGCSAIGWLGCKMVCRWKKVYRFFRKM